jgi:bacterial/archaeal transporter family protein
MLAKWLVPTSIYVLTVGALGVTSKLALRSLPWQALVMWTGIGYVIATAVLLALGQTKLTFVHGTSWAILSAALAIGGLISLYIALRTGQATKVVTVSAAYPAITLVLAALTLSEAVSLARIGGICLVIAGVIVMTVAR